MLTPGGSERTTDQNGEHEIEQTYVQYVALAGPRFLVVPVRHPCEEVEISRVRGNPHLVLWGDFVGASPRWTGYRTPIDAYGDALRAAGGRLDVIDLPAHNIRGNSHFPMMDDNSDELAALIQRWIASQGLMA